MSFDDNDRVRSGGPYDPVGDSVPYEAEDTAKAPWPEPIPFSEYDLPPFPTNALPNWLRAFVEAVAVATQTPPDLTAMLALSVCSAALAKKVVIRARDGWEEPINIYTVTALPPASRKSAVIRDVAEPMHEHEAEQAEAMRAPITHALQKRRIQEKALHTLEDKAAKASSEAERKRLVAEAAKLATEIELERIPRAVRLLADDVTPEKLISLMAEHDGRIAILSPEGGPFAMMAGRYSKEPNFEVYLKGHPGDDIRVDRHGRASEHVRRPALTLGLAVQPDVIRGLASTPGFRGRGLLGRFLYSLPASNIGSRIVAAPPVPATVKATYVKNIKALLSIDVPKNGDGSWRPLVMKLSPQAAAAFEGFEREIEPRLAEGADLGAMQDWGGKLCGAILRIVGILGINSHFKDPSIYMDESSVLNAITIGRYLIEHARAAFALMGTDENLENARHLLKVIGRKGWETFSVRDLYQTVKGDGRFKHVDALDKPLAVLEDRGFIRPTGRPQNSHNPQNRAGRKPSPAYEVNPGIARRREAVRL